MEETARLLREYEDVVVRARELVAQYDDAHLQRFPATGSWSAAECLEHLAVTAELYARRIRRALDRAPKRPSKKDHELTWFGRFFVGMMEPPVKRKFKVPSGFMPESVRPRAELLARFEETHAALIDLIEETDGVDRAKIKVPSPASSWVRLNLNDAFAVLAAHARRHLWQADRAAKAA